MLKNILHRAIRRFERQFGYDATYLHDVANHAPLAAWKFALAQWPANHRQAISRDAWHAAHLAGALSEDCGPCVQLSIDMAARDGMEPEKLAALVRGEPDAAGTDAALAFRYGLAVATNAPSAIELVEQARARFGDRGLISLAFGVTFARIYPTLKRGLGHGRACAKVVIRNETVAVKSAA